MNNQKTSVLSEKGQVTIPKELRDRLGLTANSVLKWNIKEGLLIARKRIDSSPFQKWQGRGKLPLPARSTDEYIRLIRED